MSPFTAYSLFQCDGPDQRPRELNVVEGDDYRDREADILDRIEYGSKRKHRSLSKMKCWIMSHFEQA